MDKHKTCKICGITKDYSEFYESQRGKTCKSCTLEKTRKYKREKRKDLEFRKIESKKQKLRRYRLWQNALLNDSKRKNIENNLSLTDINDIVEKQNGLCYWFKIPLEPSKNKKHPQQPSLDRLDRNKGYTKDNVVLTCYSANIGRNENDIETWMEFLKLIIK